MNRTFKKITVIGITAALGLGGCVISDDPTLNTPAATAAVGTAAGILYYSLDDGYYYDDGYNRLPRGYRPAYNTGIRRIDSMDDYRRRYPLGSMGERNRQYRIEQQREYNRMMQERLNREHAQNMLMRQRMEERHRRDALVRDRMEQQRFQNIMRERMAQQRMSEQRRNNAPNMPPHLGQDRQNPPQIRGISVRAPQDSNRHPYPWYGR